MKIKIIIICALVIFLSSLYSQVVAPKVFFYRVKVTGNVVVTHINPMKGVPDARSGILACQANTVLNLDFWFDSATLQLKYKKCTIKLKKFDCPNYGLADRCIFIPKPESYNEYKFKMDAKLKKDSATIGNPGDSNYQVHDQVELKLEPVPPLKPLVINVKCPNGAPADISDYGTTFNQVFMALNKMRYLVPVKISSTKEHIIETTVFNLYKVKINLIIEGINQPVADIKDN